LVPSWFLPVRWNFYSEWHGWVEKPSKAIVQYYCPFTDDMIWVLLGIVVNSDRGDTTTKPTKKVMNKKNIKTWTNGAERRKSEKGLYKLITESESCFTYVHAFVNNRLTQDCKTHHRKHSTILATFLDLSRVTLLVRLPL
jgi:hypothetical protein